MEDKLGEEGDFIAAIERFTEAITLNRNNYQLFSQRSAAYARVGKYTEALEDAKRCQELKPDWPKVYQRLGVAFQGLGQYEESVVVFSEGLAADPKQPQLLAGLIDAMSKSPWKANFKQKLEKFETLKLDRNPFIITSTVGQELLSANKLESSMKVLEAARAIGTDSSKLEGSLMQILGKVHWMLDNKEKALEYMELDLKINTELNDAPSCIRSHDNLGVAYSFIGRHNDAIEHHSEQFKIAEASNNINEMISALHRLGVAFTKISAYQEALNVYKDAFQLSHNINDEELVSYGYSYVAQSYLSLGDIDKAIHWYHQELKYAKDLKNSAREAAAYSHLGHSYHLKGNYDQSMMFYQQLLTVAVQMKDMPLTAKAYGGMGQANRALNSLWNAQSCREQQLKICQDTNDEQGQLVALTHLGHIHRAANKMTQAMQYYSESLKLAQKLEDKVGEAKAYSSLGACHSAQGNLSDAVDYYKKELDIVEEMEDKLSQAQTHSNLGMAYLSLEQFELSHKHLKMSVELSEEVGEKRVECQATSNLGNYCTTKKEFEEGVQYLNRALKLSQELKDITTESKVSHNLGLCYEGLGNYQEAIQHFQHDFLYAKEAQDKDAMKLACEKLVKAHTEVGDTDQADVYHQKMTSILEEVHNISGKCTLWNQLGEEALNAGDCDKAIEYYSYLLREAKKEGHQSYEGLAYRGLGNAHLSNGNYEHALSYFQHDLTVRKSSGDLVGECDAYNNMGAAHNSLGQHPNALECFENQLSLARQLDNTVLITKAYGCLGIVHRNVKNFSNALHYHQLQLTTALTLKDNILEQAGAYANLGDSYEAVGDYTQAAKNQEQHLVLAKKADMELLQIRALGSLGRAYRGLGSIRKALGYFQQRLTLAKEINDEYIEAECYADIGGIYMILKDYPQALDSYTQQLSLSRTLDDIFSEALAWCGIGEVHYYLCNYGDALESHFADLSICSQNGILDGEARALGNIADTYEAMRDYRSAIGYRERQLSVADTLRDPDIRAIAFMGLGKTYLRVDEFQQALSLLKQALSLTVKRNGYDHDGEVDMEIEAKIRFYLGQAFYLIGQNNDSMVCLQKALPLFEHLRENVSYFDHTTKQTLELLPILYQTLICVLVKINKVEEALEMAERERNRALIDALMDRDISRPAMKSCGLLKPFSPQMSWINEAIETIQCPVLYYAVALKHVFIWLLHPKSGIVQFQKVDMNELSLANASDTGSVYSENSSTYIQPLTDSISTLRESLGVEPRRQPAKSTNSSVISDDSSEDTESMASTEVSSSTLSVSSSPNKSVNMQPAYELYDLLVRPVECALPQPTQGSSYRGQVIIVPDKDLYLVPFSLLKSEGRSNFLYQQFHLRFAPSLQSLIAQRAKRATIQRKKSTSNPLTNSTNKMQQPSSQSQQQQPKSKSPTSKMQSQPQPQPQPQQQQQQVSKLQPPQQSSKLQAPQQVPSKLQPPTQQKSQLPTQQKAQSPTQPPQQHASKPHSPQLPSKLHPPQQQPSKLQPPQQQQQNSRLQPPHSKLQPPQQQGSKLQPPHQQGSKLQAPSSGLKLQPPQQQSKLQSPQQQQPQSKLQPPQLQNSKLQPPSQQNSKLQQPQLNSIKPQQSVSSPSKLTQPQQKSSKLDMIKPGSPSPKSPHSPRPKSPHSPQPTQSPQPTHSPQPKSTRSKSPGHPFAITKNHDDSTHYHPTAPVHLVVGNPSVPIIPGHTQWQSLTGAEKEIKLVSDLLNIKPLTGTQSFKGEVLKRMPEAESIYFATNVSWSKSHIVLSVKDDTTASDRSSTNSLPRRLSNEMVITNDNATSLVDPSDYTLALTDILDTKLQSKIVVISGAHRVDNPRIAAESLMVMAEALLASGAETVLIPLWPSSYQGSRLLMKAFYSSLLYGSRASRALYYAMQVVQKSQKSSHPSNWAGYMLLGKDIILRDRAVDLSKSLRLMIQSPHEHLVATLKALQAMIVTSLKHLSQGGQAQTEPKIANRSTIESKVGPVQGWEELLLCNGFHFIPSIKQDMQPSIVFPEHDDSGIQKKTHKSIEALLGLPQACVKALSVMCKHTSIARQLLNAVRSGNTAYSASHRPDAAVEIQIEKELWEIEECPTFFQNLRFSIPSTVKGSWVKVHAPAKRLDWRILQYACTAVIAVFGPEEYMDMPAQKDSVIESELL